MRLFVALWPRASRSRTNLAKRFAWWPCDGRDLVRASIAVAGLPFLAVTGHPCLTCGANKIDNRPFSFGFFGAWKWNPLVFSFLCGLSIFDLYAFAVLVNARAAIAHRPIYPARKKFRAARGNRRVAVELDLFAFASARLVLNPRQTCELGFLSLAPMSKRQPG